MADRLDERLQALSHARHDVALDGLEGAVWSRVEDRRRNSMTSGMQVGIAAAALAIGLVFGLGANMVKPHVYASELQLLSDDAIAPSIRIGGI